MKEKIIIDFLAIFFKRNRAEPKAESNSPQIE